MKYRILKNENDKYRIQINRGDRTIFTCAWIDHRRIHGSGFFFNSMEEVEKEIELISRLEDIYTIIKEGDIENVRTS